MSQDIQELYAKAMLQLENNNQTLRAISTENQRLKASIVDRSELTQEILAQYPMVHSVVIADAKEVSRIENAQNSVVLVTLFLTDKKLPNADKQRIESWLNTRFKASPVIVLVNKLSSMPTTHVSAEKN